MRTAHPRALCSSGIIKKRQNNKITPAKSLMAWRFCVARNKLRGLRNMNSLGILYFETACNRKAAE
jgi:hypothetical protein